MQSFSSGLSGAFLTTALTADSTSLTLTSVPADLDAGTYAMKIESELLLGVYSGSGSTFTSLTRGCEGTTAAAHRTVVVQHVITGDALNELRESAVQQALQSVGFQPNPLNYVRPAGLRAYLGQTFT